MRPFEHLSVLISIIIGLGLARLLLSVQQLVQAHRRVRLYWLPLAWTALVFTVQGVLSASVRKGEFFDGCYPRWRRLTPSAP